MSKQEYRQLIRQYVKLLMEEKRFWQTGMRKLAKQVREKNREIMRLKQMLADKQEDQNKNVTT